MSARQRADRDFDPTMNLSLAEEVQRLCAIADGDDYPANPVTRRLLDDRSFVHDGRHWRAAHSLDLDILRLAGTLVFARRIKRVLEIGTLFGLGTLHLAEAVDRVTSLGGEGDAGRVDTVDQRPERMLWDRHRDPSPVAIRNIHEVAESLVEESGLAERVRFLAGRSDSLLPNLIMTGKRYGLAVVDGGHDFPTVLLDVLACDNLIEDGGYMLIDDVGLRLAERDGNQGGPNRVLAALLASGRYSIVPLSANAALCRKERAS